MQLLGPEHLHSVAQRTDDGLEVGAQRGRAIRWSTCTKTALDTDFRVAMLSHIEYLPPRGGTVHRVTTYLDYRLDRHPLYFEPVPLEEADVILIDTGSGAFMTLTSEQARHRTPVEILNHSQFDLVLDTAADLAGVLDDNGAVQWGNAYDAWMHATYGAKSTRDPGLSPVYDYSQASGEYYVFPDIESMLAARGAGALDFVEYNTADDYEAMYWIFGHLCKGDTPAEPPPLRIRRTLQYGETTLYRTSTRAAKYAFIREHDDELEVLLLTEAQVRMLRTSEDQSVSAVAIKRGFIALELDWTPAIGMWMTAVYGAKFGGAGAADDALAGISTASGTRYTFPSAAARDVARRDGAISDDPSQRVTLRELIATAIGEAIARPNTAPQTTEDSMPALAADRLTTKNLSASLTSEQPAPTITSTTATENTMNTTLAMMKDAVVEGAKDAAVDASSKRILAAVANVFEQRDPAVAAFLRSPAGEPLARFILAAAADAGASAAGLYPDTVTEIAGRVARGAVRDGATALGGLAAELLTAVTPELSALQGRLAELGGGGTVLDTSVESSVPETAEAAAEVK